MGSALMASSWALPTTRLVGALSFTSLLALVTLPIVVVLRRLPHRLVLMLGGLALLYGFRAAYQLVFHRWATPGLFVLGAVFLLAALWSVPLRRPHLTSKQWAGLAAVCGLAAVVQWNAFAPRDLLQGIKRWKYEPVTRTPLGVAGHGGILLSMGLFPLLGLVALSSRNGSDETAQQ